MQFKHWVFTNGDQKDIALASINVAVDKTEIGIVSCNGYPSEDFMQTLERFAQGSEEYIEIPENLTALIPSTPHNQMQLVSATYSIDVGMVVSCSFSANVEFLQIESEGFHKGMKGRDGNGD